MGQCASKQGGAVLGETQVGTAGKGAVHEAPQKVGTNCYGAVGKELTGDSRQGGEKATAGSPEDSNIVSNPDTELILNMLHPEDGPAAGQPYQVHYLGPPRPPCEEQRMATIKALVPSMEGMTPDPEIESILKLVQSVFKAPAALCALFDEKRVFVSQQQGDVVPCGDFPWRWTLCGWSMAFKNPQVLVIPDTLQDVRFTNNVKVTVFPKVRFYCGAPLVASNGHRLGTLCFADVKPRKFDAAACVMMNNLSELVVRQLEKDIALKLQDKANKALMTTYQHLQRTMDCIEQTVVLLDTSVRGWQVVYVNAAWTKHTGLSREQLTGTRLADALEGTDGSQLPTTDMQIAAGKMKSCDIRRARLKGALCPAGSASTFTLNFRPAGRQGLDDSTLTLGVPSFLPATGGDDQASRFYFMTLVPYSHKRSSVLSASTAPSVSLAYSSSRSSRSSSDSSSFADGLELGHLLGRGSFGWVYWGTYYGTPVAVKVVDDDLREALAGAKTSDSASCREALVAHELRHPNIVATLKILTKAVPLGRPPTYDDYVLASQRLMSTRAGGFNKDSLMNTESSFDSEALAMDKAATSSGAFASATAGQSSCSNTVALGAGWVVFEEDTGDEVLLEEQDDGQMTHDGSNDDGHARIEEMRIVPMATIAKAHNSKLHGLGESTPSSRPRSLRGIQSRNSLDSAAPHSQMHGAPDSLSLTQTWMVMEFCDRGCLQDAVDRGWLRDKPDCLTSLPNMDAILATALEIASAMRYLHAHGVVHGDLTAWNVMLSSTGAGANNAGRGFLAKVADFGHARVLDLTTRITTRSYGTLTHMPPEVLVHGQISTKCDVYSFGVLLWQMFAGSRPWSGMTHAQIIMKVAQQGAKLQFGPGVPPDFRRLAEACMANDPERRPDFTTIVETLEVMAGLK